MKIQRSTSHHCYQRLMGMLSILLLCLQMNTPVFAKKKAITLKIVETSDVHGCFFPHDFINNSDMPGSLARVSTFYKQLKSQYPESTLLLDNGDILQGQPINYFSNFVDTLQHNIAADVVNYLGYDAETIGNHDVETAHACFDKWAGELHCPLLGANVINTETGKPYFKPYTIIMRQGIRIAVLGLLTPAIPNWVEQTSWKGMRFDEMIATAKHWMNIIRQQEHPDVVIGLFHSGAEGGIVTPNYAENASLAVAKEVPGFDLILFGHDHTRHQQMIKNNVGKDVLCLDPANNAQTVAVATINLEKEKGKWTVKKKLGELVDVRNYDIDQDYVKHFEPYLNKVSDFANKQIGNFAHTIYTRDSFFGNSAFNDFILNLQMKLTGADISFNAPLTLNDSIKQGSVSVRDMFKLYKYENHLYVMRLTGKEIKGYLEMSYDQWVNTMTSPNDHLFLLESVNTGSNERGRFKNFIFNFDAAAGIDYEVDVRKPNGQKVNIIRMSNGKPFEKNRWYTVAINSYRGNGGGQLLTLGAGIPHDSLKSRIVWRSERDQRYYFMKAIEEMGTVDPQPNHNWKFIPETWAKEAGERDAKLIFK